MHIPQDRPVYRVLNQHGFFGPDDHLYKEGELIYLDSEPNEELEPLNDKADKAQAEFFDKLDNLARKAAEKAGREYNGRAKGLEEAITNAHADARRTQIRVGDGGVPLMGAVKVAGVGRVEQGEAPQQRGAKGNLALDATPKRSRVNETTV